MNIVDDALIGDANLRPEIALSWRRSLMSGLDPGSAVDRPTVAEVDRRSRLLVAATPVLDQIAGELAADPSSWACASSPSLSRQPVPIARRGCGLRRRRRSPGC